MSLAQTHKPLSVLLPPPIHAKQTFRYRGISTNYLTNRVYIVDDISYQIYVYSLVDFKYLFLFEQNLFYPLDITAKQSIVAVTSYSTTTLNVFSLEGDLITSLDITCKSQGIAEDSDGGLHVCTSDCVILLYDGEVRKYGQLNNPYSIACHDQMSYVLHNNTPCLAIFDAMGMFVREILVCGGRNHIHDLVSPRNICCDTQGNLVISDCGLGGFVVFDSSGSAIYKMLCRDGVINGKDCNNASINPLFSLMYSDGVDTTANGDVVISCNRHKEAALIVKISE